MVQSCFSTAPFRLVFQTIRGGMNKPAQGCPRAGFYPTILPMKLRTPHYERRSLYLPPSGLLLMEVRVRMTV
ncbi:hypothetical protein HMPREF3038_02774 [Akkermansia sp. KLE1797]|nr:hypothetical protein HMPREF3038_02774 [Akkermansia sp. KLE1797]KZA03764.1 hypothetical protein HMPREF1326_02537 [Akkermansia sp. KLE1605]